MHVGEGAYDEAEQLIQKLLAEDNKQTGDKSKVVKPVEVTTAKGQ